MRYGNGSNEIMSITLKPETMKRWAYSTDTCSRIVDRWRYREHVRSQWKVGSDESWKKPSRIT